MKKDGIDADIDAGGLDDKAKEMRVMWSHQLQLPASRNGPSSSTLSSFSSQFVVNHWWKFLRCWPPFATAHRDRMMTMRSPANPAKVVDD